MRCTCNSQNPPNSRYCSVCGGELGDAPSLSPAPLNPAKRRTLYEPPAAAPPSPQAPADSGPGALPGDFFGTPLPPRGGFNPDDPFRVGNWQPPERNQTAAETAPPAASPGRRRAATILERPAAPAASLRGVLLDSDATDREGLHPVRAGRNSVGRDPDADISLGDGKVSTQHGFLFIREEGASFIDTSTNGSIVDGQVVHGSQVDLAHGSTLVLGETRLVLLLSPARPT